MRKNRRKPKKLPVMADMAVRFVVILMALFVMVIINLLATSSCRHKLAEQGDKKRLLASLEKERVRQSENWIEMTTRTNLERRLRDHGLNMDYAKADQVVRMMAGGVPYPSQVAVSRAQQRKTCNTAQNGGTRNRIRRR